MVTFKTIDRDVMRPWISHVVVASTGAGFAADLANAALEAAAAGTSAVVTPPAAARPPL
jgi:hypothetical protein